MSVVAGARVGQFTLTRRIGKGGMADVWAAVHREQGVDVAVKVLTAQRARDAQCLDALRNEVRAMASLLHPNVVEVYDHGVLEGASKTEDGSPYLVMERAQATVSSKGRMGLSTLRALLLELLDGLAHAHARGLVHRDLKPANVLISRAGKALLSDFGLAHAVDAQVAAAGGPRVMAGTPAYMAPEQILAETSSLGPPTDLYALGCMAYALAAGRSPFAGGRVESVLERHLREPLPKLPEDVGAPAAFEEWLAMLTRKDPGVRFQRAADAAQWLIEEVRDSGDEPDFDEPTALLTLATLSPGTHTPTLSSTTLRELEEARRLEALDRSLRPPRPAHMPGSWRGPERMRALHLGGVGLGLFGVRRIPLVDREDERDALWHALRACRSQGARAVVVRSASGLGKSRLAEWLCERAHELGAAEVIRVTHGPTFAAGDGLEPAARRYLATTGLDVDEARRQTFRWALQRGGRTTLEPDLDTLAALVAPSSGHLVLSTAAERHAAFALLLSLASRHRPVLVWVDDVQWGPDALRCVKHVLDRHAELPLLFVLTAREESLDRMIERRLADLPRVTEIRLGPLPEAERPRLVQELLGLDAALAREVLDRTGGNPLFAVQLVGDWVQRGILRVGRGGFERRPDADTSIPDDMHAMWNGRIRFALRDDAQALEWLGVAAALGRDVDLEEWAVATGADPTQLQLLADKLVRFDLARSDESSRWSFAHGLLRESIERDARETGRWLDHNAACAQAAAALGAPLEREGRFRLEAAEPQRAAQLLMIAVEELLRAGDHERARAVIDLCGRALGAARTPAESPAWARLSLLEALCSFDAGEASEARARLVALAARCEKRGLVGLLPDVLLGLGRVQTVTGEVSTSMETFERALALGRALPRWPDEMMCLERIAWALAALGRVDEARQRFRELLRMPRMTGEGWLEPSALRGLACVAQDQGRLDDALDLARRAVEAAKRCGHAQQLVQSHNALGDIARRRGELELAEQSYRAASALHRDPTSLMGVVLRTNMALLRVEGGEVETGRRELLELTHVLEEQGMGSLLAEVLSGLLLADATLDDVDAFDGTLRRLSEVLAASGRGAPDILAGTRMAADRMIAAGHRARGARALSITAAQLRLVGRLGEAEAVEARIWALDRR